MSRLSTIAEDAVTKFGALQKPQELTDFLTLITTRYGWNYPNILEIGCDTGGSLWAFTQIPTANVYGLTIVNGSYSTKQGLHFQDAHMVIGDSHNPDSLNAIHELTGGTIDVLFIDGDHTYDGVRQDFLDYSPMVSDNGIVAFHDICDGIGRDKSVGVPEFWKELKAGEMGEYFEEIIYEPHHWGGIGVIKNG